MPLHNVRFLHFRGRVSYIQPFLRNFRPAQILEERVAALERFCGASVESEFETGLAFENTIHTLLAHISQLESLLLLLEPHAAFDPSQLKLTENRLRDAASNHLAQATVCNTIQTNVVDLAFRYGELVRSVSAQFALWSAQLDQL